MCMTTWQRHVLLPPDAHWKSGTGLSRTGRTSRHHGAFGADTPAAGGSAVFRAVGSGHAAVQHYPLQAQAATNRHVCFGNIVHVASSWRCHYLLQEDSICSKEAISAKQHHATEQCAPKDRCQSWNCFFCCKSERVISRNKALVPKCVHGCALKLKLFINTGWQPETDTRTDRHWQTCRRGVFGKGDASNTVGIRQPCPSVVVRDAALDSLTPVMVSFLAAPTPICAHTTTAKATWSKFCDYLRKRMKDACCSREIRGHVPVGDRSLARLLICAYCYASDKYTYEHINSRNQSCMAAVAQTHASSYNRVITNPSLHLTFVEVGAACMY